MFDHREHLLSGQLEVVGGTLTLDGLDVTEKIGEILTAPPAWQLPVT